MEAYGEGQTPPHRYILGLFYLTAQAGEGGQARCDTPEGRGHPRPATRRTVAERR